MKKIWIISILIITSLFFSQCGGVGKKKPVYPNKVNSVMQTAFAVAENYYQSQSYQSALNAYDKFIQSFPYNRLTDEAYYKQAKIYFIQEKWNQAIESLTLLSKKTPDPKYKAKATLFVANVFYQKNEYVQSQNYLTKIDVNELSTKLKIQYFSLFIDVGGKLSLPKDKIDYAFLRLADVYKESADRSLTNLRAKGVYTEREALSHIEDWIVTPISSDKIPPWFRSYPGGFSKAFVEYKLGKIYYESGEKDHAKKQLSAYIKSYPKHDYVEKAKKMLEELGGAIPTLTSGGGLKIGVILPLSGPRASFGEATLRGIKCATGEISGCRSLTAQEIEGLGQVQLLIRDSKDDEAQIDILIPELVHDGAHVIIGPMSASLAEVAAKKAQEVHVVLFPITQKSGIMEIGDFIFQMGYETKHQIEDLVRIARSRGIKSFGVFYPESNYGREMSQFFQDEMKTKGGKIESIAGYNPSEIDLARRARALKLGVSRFSFGGKSSGFEALFIPDSYWMVNRIIPALKFVTIQDIALMGTNAWNDGRLTQSVSDSYPNSFFLDLFYAGHSSGMTPAFVSTFKTSFGREPTSLEAIGFDAVYFTLLAAKQSLLGTASKTKSLKSSQIKEALLSFDNFRGVTSIRSFQVEKGPVIQSFVLTTDKDGIKLAQ